MSDTDDGEGVLEGGKEGGGGSLASVAVSGAHRSTPELSPCFSGDVRFGKLYSFNMRSSNLSRVTALLMTLRVKASCAATTAQAEGMW